MMDESDDSAYYKRAAVHGGIDPAGAPDDIEITDEELDDIIEILYVRERDEYRTVSRHIGHGVLHLRYGTYDHLGAAYERGIEASRETGYPILGTVYTYIPENEDELGEGRIPVPWEDDEHD